MVTCPAAAGAHTVVTVSWSRHTLCYDRKALMRERRECTMFMDQKTRSVGGDSPTNYLWILCSLWRSQSSSRVLVGADKLILKFMWKGRGDRTTKPVSEKKKVGGFMAPDVTLTAKS